MLQALAPLVSEHARLEALSITLQSFGQMLHVIRASLCIHTCHVVEMETHLAIVFLQCLEASLGQIEVVRWYDGVDIGEFLLQELHTSSIARYPTANDCTQLWLGNI